MLIAFLAFFIFSSASPAYARRIYSPIVEPGAKEIEYHLDTSSDSDPTKHNRPVHELEFSYSIENWAFAIYGQWGNSHNNKESIHYKKTKLEVIHQLFEQGEYFLDAALYFEYQLMDGRVKDNDVFEFKLLLEKEFGNTIVTLNPIYKKELTEKMDLVETYEYATSVQYRLNKLFIPGVEFYGTLGKPGDFKSLQNEKHYAGPAVYGKYGSFEYRFVLLYGLSNQSDNLIFSTTIGFEYY